MSITDELRKWAEDNTLRDRVLTTYPPQHAVHGVLETLLRIADRIDAEHEAMLEDARKYVYAGYVELPKDAHGEYIRAGDTLDGYGKTIEVVEMRYGRGGWVLISRDGSGYADTFAFAHHHKPTVEDVLREMHAELDEVTALYVGEAIDSDERDRDEARIFAEYAKRLTLAESEDA